VSAALLMANIQATLRARLPHETDLARLADDDGDADQLTSCSESMLDRSLTIAFTVAIRARRCLTMLDRCVLIVANKLGREKTISAAFWGGINGPVRYYYGMPGRHTVLVVEDDPSLRRMYRTALGLAGFSVTEAEDGLHALHYLEQHPPDIVILDLMLPTVSGLVVQQEIAAHAHTRKIPVVIVTGSDMNLDGVDVPCVLRKPVTPDKLVDVVQSCLQSGAPGMGS
jgi:CheY-like chemotaxis protein